MGGEERWPERKQLSLKVCKWRNGFRPDKYLLIIDFYTSVDHPFSGEKIWHDWFTSLQIINCFFSAGRVLFRIHLSFLWLPKNPQALGRRLESCGEPSLLLKICNSLLPLLPVLTPCFVFSRYWLWWNKEGRRNGTRASVSRRQGSWPPLESDRCCEHLPRRTDTHSEI